MIESQVMFSYRHWLLLGGFIYLFEASVFLKKQAYFWHFWCRLTSLFLRNWFARSFRNWVCAFYSCFIKWKLMYLNICTVTNKMKIDLYHVIILFFSCIFIAVNHLDCLGVQVAWVSGPWFLSIFVNMLPWESGKVSIESYS